MASSRLLSSRHVASNSADLVCSQVFFEHGSIEQLFVSLIVCFLTFGLYCALIPYEDYIDDTLARLCQVQLLCCPGSMISPDLRGSPYTQVELFFCLLCSLILRTNPNSAWLAIGLPLSLLLPPARPSTAQTSDQHASSSALL